MATTSIVQARRGPANVGFIAAGACTAVAGAVLLFGLQPVTDVSDDMWRYPWSNSGAFVAFSLFSAALHGLVIAGLVAFGHSGAAGRSRTATIGVALAIAGTALLLVGELASIPIRDAEVDDTSAGIVGAIFGIGGTASTIGFLLTGWATLRAGVWHGWRRFTPLAVGLWLVILTPVTLAAPTLLHGGVGVYGLCLLAMAVALYTAPTPTVTSDPAAAAIPGVEPHLERA
ncbi:MAG: hypothetical protein WAS51_08705 [Ilumatobacteraceae bacterium]